MNDTITARIEVREDDPTRGKVLVSCPLNGECRFSVWHKAANGITWHWDGNVETPTISPSIGCDGGCKRHFTIVNGIGQP